MSFDPQSLPPHFQSLKLSDFQYELPQQRIAKFPLDQRDQSKLLHFQAGKISHRQFFELPEMLPPDTLLVFNNTKVVKARLYFRRATGALIEILLLNPTTPSEIQLALQRTRDVSWNCVIGNKKRWKEDEVLKMGLEIEDREVELEVSWVDKGENEVKFEWNNEVPFTQILESMGKLPLPPYLNRAATEQDLHQYQTVYAKKEGAVAAPTAGLHFTEEVLKNLHSKDIPSLEVTLHVGAGTFLPVKEEEVVRHRMHEEQMVLELDKIKELAQSERKIIPVGTTAMRFLESIHVLGEKILRGEKLNPSEAFQIGSYEAYQGLIPPPKEALEAIIDLMEAQGVKQWVGETQIYILPGYKFRLCQGLITNFHMPETTLMLLVAALVGDFWKEIYQSALDNGYRFLSYGDSSLLLPD